MDISTYFRQHTKSTRQYDPNGSLASECRSHRPLLAPNGCFCPLVNIQLEVAHRFRCANYSKLIVPFVGIEQTKERKRESGRRRRTELSLWAAPLHFQCVFIVFNRHWYMAICCSQLHTIKAHATQNVRELIHTHTHHTMYIDRWNFTNALVA